MRYCYKCSVSETNTILSEAISTEGIVDICGHCLKKDNVPLVNRGVSEEEEAKETHFSERARIEVSRRHSVPVRNAQDENLRNLVEANFKRGLKEDLDTKSLLVRNFHWIILRARRNKKLSHSELAGMIHESDIVVKTLEKGIVPERSREIITKLERVLGVYLREKPEPEEESMVSKLSSEGGIDFSSVGDLSLSELRETSEMKEEEEHRE